MKKQKTTADSSPLNTDVMRYFLITYYYQDNLKRVKGNISSYGPQFPQNEDLKKLAAKQLNGKAECVVITNVFEFKNKEDYDNFWGT